MSWKLPDERIESQKSDGFNHAVEVAIVKLLLSVGFHQKRVASLFDCSQGRVTEVATGQNGPGVSFLFKVTGGDSYDAQK